MEKHNLQKIWQVVAFLACEGVLWVRLGDFGGSEFIGGRLTGKLFAMAELASMLFILAVLMTSFFPRIGAVIALAASLLCVPFYRYVIMPGPYRQIFRGQYSVPLGKPIVWNTWAALGMLSLTVVGALSVRGLLKLRG